VTQERTGVLLLRVWADETDRGLRARITKVLDISTADEHVVIAGSVEEIERAVRDWLTEFSPPKGMGVRVNADGQTCISDQIWEWDTPEPGVTPL
jgi:hypothetical protein